MAISQLSGVSAYLQLKWRSEDDLSLHLATEPGASLTPRRLLNRASDPKSGALLHLTRRSLWGLLGPRDTTVTPLFHLEAANDHTTYTGKRPVEMFRLQASPFLFFVFCRLQIYQRPRCRPILAMAVHARVVEQRTTYQGGQDRAHCDVHRFDLVSDYM
jgi:hypothetical protein